VWSPIDACLQAVIGGLSRVRAGAMACIGYKNSQSAACFKISAWDNNLTLLRLICTLPGALAI
jgi:hypothetical protein